MLHSLSRSVGHLSAPLGIPPAELYCSASYSIRSARHSRPENVVVQVPCGTLLLRLSLNPKYFIMDHVVNCELGHSPCYASFLTYRKYPFSWAFPPLKCGRASALQNFSALQVIQPAENTFFSAN